MATMPGQVQRRQRTRNWALYGVTLVSIVMVVVIAQIVGHEAAGMASKITQGLAH